MSFLYNSTPADYKNKKQEWEARLDFACKVVEVKTEKDYANLRGPDRKQDDPQKQFITEFVFGKDYQEFSQVDKKTRHENAAYGYTEIEQFLREYVILETSTPEKVNTNNSSSDSDKKNGQETKWLTQNMCNAITIILAIEKSLLNTKLVWDSQVIKRMLFLYLEKNCGIKFSEQQKGYIGLVLSVHEKLASGDPIFLGRLEECAKNLEDAFGSLWGNESSEESGAEKLKNKNRVANFAPIKFNKEDTFVSEQKINTVTSSIEEKIQKEFSWDIKKARFLVEALKKLNNFLYNFGTRNSSLDFSEKIAQHEEEKLGNSYFFRDNLEKLNGKESFTSDENEQGKEMQVGNTRSLR